METPDRINDIKKNIHALLPKNDKGEVHREFTDLWNKIDRFSWSEPGLQQMYKIISSSVEVWQAKRKLGKAKNVQDH